MEKRECEREKGGKCGKECDWVACVVFVLCRSLKDLAVEQETVIRTQIEEYGKANGGKKPHKHVMTGAPKSVVPLRSERTYRCSLGSVYPQLQCPPYTWGKEDGTVINTTAPGWLIVGPL